MAVNSGSGKNRPVLVQSRPWAALLMLVVVIESAARKLNP